MQSAICCLWQGTDLPKTSGGQYGPEYVEALRDGLKKHWPVVELICLADEDYDIPGVTVRRFKKDWPGWWKRLEAFRPEFWPAKDERLVLLDLDMIIVGDCSWIGEWDRGPVGMTRDPFLINKRASTVVSVSRAGAKHVWESAVSNNAENYAYLGGAPSEMLLLRVIAKETESPLLEEQPAKLLSYKKHVRSEKRSWQDASIIYFHGLPKPHHLPDDHPLKAEWTHTQPTS